MCMWTKIKQISAIGSVVAVIISVITLLSLVFWWVGNEALANDRIDTLWSERTTKDVQYAELKDCIADIKTDMAVVKNDTVWIKEHLKSNR